MKNKNVLLLSLIFIFQKLCSSAVVSSGTGGAMAPPIFGRYNKQLGTQTTWLKPLAWKHILKQWQHRIRKPYDDAAGVFEKNLFQGRYFE